MLESRRKSLYTSPPLGWRWCIKSPFRQIIMRHTFVCSDTVASHGSVVASGGGGGRNQRDIYPSRAMRLLLLLVVVVVCLLSLILLLLLLLLSLLLLFNTSSVRGAEGGSWAPSLRTRSRSGYICVCTCTGICIGICIGIGIMCRHCFNIESKTRQQRACKLVRIIISALK